MKRSRLISFLTVFPIEVHLLEFPIATVEAGWNGWLEDRRPASNADPYKVAANIINTVKDL